MSTEQLMKGWVFTRSYSCCDRDRCIPEHFTYFKYFLNKNCICQCIKVYRNAIIALVWKYGAKIGFQTKLISFFSPLPTWGFKGSKSSVCQEPLLFCLAAYMHLNWVGNQTALNCSHGKTSVTAPRTILQYNNTYHKRCGCYIRK